jgi:hypothetical protein
MHKNKGIDAFIEENCEYLANSSCPPISRKLENLIEIDVF